MGARISFDLIATGLAAGAGTTTTRPPGATVAARAARKPATSGTSCVTHTLSALGTERGRSGSR